MINKLYAMISFLILLAMIPVDVIYGASIRITWNANQESDLSGYKVYYGTSAGQYGTPRNAGNVTDYEIAGLNEGVRYYISLTAYDTSDNESAKSVEISGIAQSPTTTTAVATTLPSSTSTTASSTSSVRLVTTTTVPISTTTTAVTTTQLSSTSTTALPAVTTTTVLPDTTTSSAITSTQPSSSTTSVIMPITTTTTSTGEETATCDEPVKQQPLFMTASTALRPFFPLDNLIDGNLQTAWSTFFTFFRKDGSITLDMGSEKTITSLSLYASRIFGIDVLPANIELQISNDNNTWETISAPAVSADLESANLDSWEINGHKCRYIKLCISGRKTFFLFQLAQIAELEIYGCDAADLTPFSEKSSSSSETIALPSLNESATDAVNDESLAPGIPGRPLISFK